MKAKFKPNPAAIIILACIIISVTGNVWILVGGVDNPPVKIAVAKILKPIDDWRIPDTIPYNKYNKLKDSLTSMRDLKNGDCLTYNWRKFAYLGTQVSLACDTCTYEWLKRKRPVWLMLGVSCDTCINKLYDGHVQYYIKLYAWSIKNREWLGDDDCVFYVKNSQGYLRESFEDTTKNRLASGRIYLDDVPVKFRYSDKDDALLIPVSKRGANLFDLTCRALVILYAVGLLVLLYVFIRFIYDMSKGTFTRKNVVRLRFLSVVIVSYPVMVILVNLLMKLLFHNYFTEDIVLKDVLWTDAWDALPLGILFSLLYLAFSRAVALQEEHDLTV